VHVLADAEPEASGQRVVSEAGWRCASAFRNRRHAVARKLADPGSPTLIQDKDPRGALYVLMPMRV
jgi:hypothetical protein